MPLNFDRLSFPPDVKVFIHNTEGKYLTRGDQSWVFTDNRLAATIFYYAADRVAEQLETLRKTQGIVLEAVPVPLDEIYENCDRCGELFMPSMIVFDGKQFLCAECRSHASRRPARPRPAA
jgi:hypothetical protein